MPLVTTSLENFFAMGSTGFCLDFHDIFTVDHGIATIPPPLNGSVARCKSLILLDFFGPFRASTASTIENSTTMSTTTL